VRLSRALSHGSVTFRLLGPMGEQIQELTARDKAGSDSIELMAQAPSTFVVTADAKNAVGQWRVLVCKAPSREALRPVIYRAIAVLVVIILASLIGRRAARMPLPWLAVGLAVFLASAIVGVLINQTFSLRILPWLAQNLSQVPFMVIATPYLVIVLALSLIGVVYLAGYTWLGLVRTGGRALAIGIGVAGGRIIRAAAEGLYAYVQLGSGRQGSASQLVEMVLSISRTPWASLISLVEPGLDLLCTTAACMLALLAVAKPRGRLFGAALLLTMGINLLGTVMALAGLSARISLWWMELYILPFAIASLLIIRWCLLRWPSPPEALAPAELQPPASDLPPEPLESRPPEA
jgi:hypothetical protein